MTKRGIFGWLLVAVAAIFLFKMEMTNAHAQSEPQHASFDLVLKTVQSGAKDIDKVVFIKDERGTVQEVLVNLKSGNSLQAEVPGDAGTTRLMSATEQSGVPTDAKKVDPSQNAGAGAVFWTLLQIFGPMLVIVLLFVWMSRNAMNAQNGIRSQITNSKVNEVQPDKDRKTFADVAGCEEAKQELQDVIQYLRDPGLLAELGGQPYKGVLLIGGPGNGKT